MLCPGSEKLHWFLHFKTTKQNVIAWMPLPYRAYLVQGVASSLGQRLSIIVVGDPFVDRIALIFCSSC